MIIPKTLAKNSGFDPQDSIIKLQVCMVELSFVGGLLLGLALSISISSTCGVEVREMNENFHRIVKKKFVCGSLLINFVVLW